MMSWINTLRTSAEDLGTLGGERASHKKRLTGKHEVAAREESEILQWQHIKTTTAATHEESEILERQHMTTTAAATDDETEMLEQQHATRVTAAPNDVAEKLDQKHAATTAAITHEKTKTTSHLKRDSDAVQHGELRSDRGSRLVKL